MSEAYSYDADELLEAADIEAADEREPYDPGMPEEDASLTGGAPTGPDTGFEEYGDFEGGLQGEPEPSMLPDMSNFDNGAPTDQPVPRIAIQAFCERPETAKLIQRSAGDRRLAKAQVTVNMGGLPTAIETFHDKSTPHLIIVESGMQGQGLFSQLDELAAVCDPETNVIVIGAANDISLYRELMRKGVSEYLVPPLSPVQLISSIAGIYVDPEAPFAGRTVAFVGAKGGAGSSTIAHHVGWCIAENAHVNATIVDLDLPFGTAGLDFNQDPTQGVADALREPERLDDVLLERLLSRCTDRLTLFSAPGTLDREWEMDAAAYEQVIDTVRRSVPYVMLDIPHGWNRWTRNTLLSADEIVVTATPDLASLRNAKNLFDLVRAQRPNDGPPKIVLNQVGVPKRPEIPVKDFCEALGAEPTLVLPYEPAIFGAAANNGQMVNEMRGDSKAAEGMLHLARVITGRHVESQSKSLFSKLLGRG